MIRDWRSKRCIHCFQEFLPSNNWPWSANRQDWPLPVVWGPLEWTGSAFGWTAIGVGGIRTNFGSLQVWHRGLWTASPVKTVFLYKGFANCLTRNLKAINIYFLVPELSCCNGSPYSTEFIKVSNIIGCLIFQNFY